MVCEESAEVYEEHQDTSSGVVIISFLIGFGIGAFGSFLITRKKMREEKETEIADITSYYGNLQNSDDGVTSVSFEFAEEDHPRDDLPPEDKPFPISQKEYVEDLDFAKETVVYYENDEILTDMFDRIIEINDTTGKDALTHFGDEEEDVSYSRNEKLGIDYEIILEHKSFASVVGEDLED